MAHLLGVDGANPNTCLILFLTIRLLISYLKWGPLKHLNNGCRKIGWLVKAHSLADARRQDGAGNPIMQGTALMILMSMLPAAALLTPEVPTAIAQILSLPLPKAQAPLAEMTPFLCIYLTPNFLILERRTLGANAQLAPWMIPSFREGSVSETIGGASLPILIPSLLLVQFLVPLISSPIQKLLYLPYACRRDGFEEISALLTA